MARLSRKLRVCKWAGTVGCVLIVAAFVWSGWGSLYVDWTPGMPAPEDSVDYPFVNAYRFDVHGGYIELCRARESNPNYANCCLIGHHSSWIVFHGGVLPRTVWYSTFSDFGVLLPLWLPGSSVYHDSGRWS